MADWQSTFDATIDDDLSNLVRLRFRGEDARSKWVDLALQLRQRCLHIGQRVPNVTVKLGDGCSCEASAATPCARAGRAPPSPPHTRTHAQTRPPGSARACPPILQRRACPFACSTSADASTSSRGSDPLVATGGARRREVGRGGAQWGAVGWVRARSPVHRPPPTNHAA